MVVRVRVLHRAVAPVLAVALAAPVGLYSSTSRAAGPASETKLSRADEAALAQAREMFEQGKAKYDTFDYKGAIDLWQRAYAKVPEAEAGVRIAMVYNIALAQEKAYDIDKDVAHLRQAVMLLEEWLRHFKALYEKTPENAAEVKKAKEKIAELNRKIAIANGEEPAPEPTDGDGDDDDIEFDSGYEPPPEVIEANKKEAAKRESRTLIIAGYATGGAGLLFIAGGAAGVALVPGQLGVGGGVGLMALGGVALIAGGVLLGIGYKKKKALKRGEYSIVPTPILGPRTAGAAVTVRF